MQTKKRSTVKLVEPVSVALGKCAREARVTKAVMARRIMLAHIRKNRRRKSIPHASRKVPLSMTLLVEEHEAVQEIAYDHNRSTLQEYQFAITDYLRPWMADVEAVGPPLQDEATSVPIEGD